MYTVDRERAVDGERFPYDVDICLAEELMRAHARKGGGGAGVRRRGGVLVMFLRRFGSRSRLALAARPVIRTCPTRPVGAPMRLGRRQSPVAYGAPRSEEALAFCSPSLPVPRLSAIPQPAKLRDSKGPPGSRQRLATTAPFRGPSSLGSQSLIIMSGDLIKAAKAGDVAEARRCLDAGADGKRNEALMEAARCGHAEVRKVVSRSSFALKGGGWYSDHYGLRPSASPE